jgi:hypothetical protein
VDVMFAGDEDDIKDAEDIGQIWQFQIQIAPLLTHPELEVPG